MSSTLQMPMPGALAKFHLPKGVQQRLQALLDQQDSGQKLTPAERREAEGLVEMAEWLSLLQMRAGRKLKTTLA